MYNPHPQSCPITECPVPALLSGRLLGSVVSGTASQPVFWRQHHRPDTPGVHLNSSPLQSLRQVSLLCNPLIPLHKESVVMKRGGIINRYNLGAASKTPAHLHVTMACEFQLMLEWACVEPCLLAICCVTFILAACKVRRFGHVKL